MKNANRLGLVLACLLVTIVTSVCVRADDAVLVFSGKVPGGAVTLTRDDIAARLIPTGAGAEAEPLSAFAQIGLPDPAPALLAHLTSIFTTLQIALAW